MSSETKRIKISAVICTHNRDKHLYSTIKSLVDQSIDKSIYEIIVVDNASTDNTMKVIKQFEGEKNFRFIQEPKLGLSYARNLGWKKAAGEFVAFIDDDAVACKGWLQRILAAFQSVPNLGAVGGKIEPIWEESPPPWLDDFMKRSLSLLDWSPAPMILDDKKYLVGTNIAFPKKIFEEVSGFSVCLGRKGKSLISNDEIDLIRKIKKMGRDIYYDPEILVKHTVFSSRLRPKWFRKRWFMQGFSNAIMYYNLKAPSRIKKISFVIKWSADILIRPHLLIVLLFPSIFPKLIRKSHDCLSGLGFIYGLHNRK